MNTIIFCTEHCSVLKYDCFEVFYGFIQSLCKFWESILGLETFLIHIIHSSWNIYFENDKTSLNKSGTQMFHHAYDTAVGMVSGNLEVKVDLYVGNIANVIVHHQIN